MSTISAGTTSGTALVASGDTTGSLVFQTNGTTTALTIGTNQVVTFAATPAITGGATVVTTTDTQTLTNKTLAFGSNTFTGALGVANGGTGATTLAANNVLLGNGTSAVQAVAPGASGNLLISNGTTWTSTAPTAPTIKVWSAYTSTATYTVPAGVTSIRVYAWGAGGNAAAQIDYGNTFYYVGSGAGGGCAFGDLAVTPGTTVTITISSGNSTISYASVTRFTANKGENCTTPASNPSTPLGGTASIGTGVTNGNAYAGGNGSPGGINQGPPGGSSGSPLGVGAAPSGYGGRGWGTGNGGSPPTSFIGLGPSGGAGGAPTADRPGDGRGGYLVYTDPLLESLTSPGVQGVFNSGTGIFGATGGPGAGGGGAGTTSINAVYGGNGGFGGGGGGCYAAAQTTMSSGSGGFGASAGGGYCGGTYPTLSVGISGYGAGASGMNSGSGNYNYYAIGTAGAAIVLIYA